MVTLFLAIIVWLLGLYTGWLLRDTIKKRRVNKRLLRMMEIFEGDNFDWPEVGIELVDIIEQA